MRILAISLFLITFFARADNYPKNEALDLLHYIFQVELNDSTDRINGLATLSIQIKKPIKEFELDLVSLVRGKGMTVDEVRLNDKLIIFSHRNNRLKILLPSEAPAEKEIKISIKYHGIPGDGLIISKNLFGDRTFFGDNWPDRARNWLPSIDHPYDKAKVDFIVTAPAHYQVVANGIRLEESHLSGGQKLTHWSEPVPIPTKVMVIGVARFAIHHAGDVGNIPVESWVYPQNRMEGFSDYSPAVKVLEFFTRQIGDYPYQKLANVQSTTMYGGMENANTIFYYEKSVSGRGEIEGLIAHEISHQWFGNSASEKDWHHVWLSEGFATYFAHVYNEFTYGPEKLKEGLISDRKTVIDYCIQSPGPVIDPRITDYPKLLSPHVYQRGGWVLHMLRREVGEEAFWNGIRMYYSQYKNSNALTSDLQKIMEEASGKDLAQFFKQWTEQTSIPKFSVQWVYDDKTKAVTISLEQLQSGPPFQTEMEIGFFPLDESKREVQKLKIRQKTEKITLNIPNKPVRIVLDPNTNLLFEGKVGN